MGQRCDLRMTRPRLVGVCFGVLLAVAAVMALLSFLAVRRFKSMLMQAKVEQTRSRYHMCNHFKHTHSHKVAWFVIGNSLQEVVASYNKAEVVIAALK